MTTTATSRGMVLPAVVARATRPTPRSLALDLQSTYYQCCCGMSVVRGTYFLAYMHLAMAFTTFMVGILLADYTIIIGLCLPLATLIGMCSSLAVVGLRLKNPHLLKPLVLLLIFEALLSGAAAIWSSVGLYVSIEQLNGVVHGDDEQGSDGSRQEYEEQIGGTVTMLVMMIALIIFFCWCSMTVNKCIKFWLHLHALHSLPGYAVSDEVALEMNWNLLQRQSGIALPPPPPPYHENQPVVLRPDQINTPRVQVHSMGSFDNPPPDYDTAQNVVPPAYDQLSLHMDIPSTSDQLVKDGDHDGQVEHIDKT